MFEKKVMKTLGGVGLSFFGLACLAFAGELKPALDLSFDQSNSAFKAMPHQPGVSGEAVVIGEGDGKLLHAEFNAGNILSSREGTVMFWVKPLNWNVGDKQHHVFFEAQGPDARMTIYQYAGHDQLQFLFGPARHENAKGQWQWTQVLESIKHWKHEEWHFIACTWNKTTVQIYVDGELKKTQTINAVPSSLFDRFWIGPGLWNVQNAGDQTAIDEVKIYKKVLSSQILYDFYQQHKPEGSSHNAAYQIVLPQNNLIPKIDGKIIPGEYAFSGMGFLNVLGGLFEHQSRYYLSYDQKKLYIAVSSPIIGALQKGLDITVMKDPSIENVGLIARSDGRDSAVYRDDSIELYLCPSGSKDCYQFIFNSKGTIYDSRNQDIGWNCSGLKLQNGVDEKTWTLEIAIPFESLGVEPPVSRDSWKINVCRSFSSLSAAMPISTCIAPVNGLYSDTSKYPHLIFVQQGPIVGLKSIGQVAQGALDFDLELSNVSSLQGGMNVQVDLRLGEASLASIDKHIGVTDKANIPLQKNGFSGSGTLNINVTDSSGQSWYKASMPYTTLEPLIFQSIYTLIDKQRLCLGLKQGRVTYEGKMPITQVRLLDKTGKQVLEKSFSDATNTEYTVQVDIHSIPVGDYDIEVTYYHPNGQLLATLKETYTKYPTPAPWMNNTIGVSDEVLAPWVPMEVKGSEITLWGRSYRFDHNLFPTQIQTQGRSLLTGPIQLVGLQKNRSIINETTRVDVVEAKPNKVKLVADGRIGNVKIASNILMEYDGFMWCDLTLTPVGKTTLDRLVLEIPLRSEYASLVNSRHSLRSGSGKIPEAGWMKDLESHFPIFWVGNEDVGLEWFAESLSGWHVKDASKSALIIHRDDQVIVQLNLIDSPLTFSKQRKIAFGLMATPVRPNPVGWRNWRIGEWSRHPYYGKSKEPWSQNLSLWFEPNYRYYNYPEVIKPTLSICSLSSFAGQSLAEAEKLRGRVCVYHSFAESTPFCPEFKWQGKEWIVTPEAGKYAFDQKSNEHVTVDLNSASYRDFYIWKLKQSIEGNKIHGLYFDFGHPSLSMNPGWMDDEGKKHAVFPILGCRDLARRIYTVMKTYDPNSIIAYHCSQGEVMAFEAYSDVLYTGEDYVMAVIAQNYRYYNLISLDQFRAQYMARQWGPVPVHHAQFIRSIQFFEPQKRSWWDQNGKPFVDHLAGLYLVHDAQYDDIWGFSILNMEKIKSDFGLDDQTEFLPYWNNADYVKILSPASRDFVISLYRKNGKVLLIAFNNTDRDETLQVQLNLKQLVPAGLKNPENLTDLVDTQKIPLHQDTTAFLLKARSYRMLNLE